MAGEVPPLNVEILVQLSNLTAAVTEATAGLNKIGDGAKAQESKFSSLKSTMLGVFAGNLMTKGAEMLATGLHDAVKAIEDTQVATEQLATAMNNAKQNTAANREEITKTSEKMGALGFSVADSEKAYTKLITATGSTTESTKLMSMAADLARYKHESLADASATLVKGTMGNAKAFKEFGIVLDAHLPKNQAIAKAMDELNSKIGGQAVGYTHTFAGEMEILKAKFDDVAVKVGAVVMPILTKLMELIQKVLIPVIVFLYKNTIGAWIGELIKLWNTHEGLRKVIVDVLKVVVDGFGYLLGAIAKVVDTVAKIPVLGAPFKAIGKGIDEAALSVGKFGSSLDSLANKKIVLPTLGSVLATSGGTSAGGDTGITGGLGAAGDVNKAAAAAQKALDARNATIKKLNDQAVTLNDQMNAVLLERQTKMADAQKTLDDKRLAAQTKYDETVANIQQTYDDKVAAAQEAYNNAVENAQTSHEQNMLSIQQQYADKATQLIQKANDQQGSIINQSIGLMTSAFEGATKIDLGKLFTAGAGTASGLQDQLKTQLNDVTKLQKDAGLLSAQGYNQAFIDEVISQGPQQGDALAQSVLSASPETQAAIKTLYDQINTISQNGVTDLATKMNDGVHFADQKLAEQFATVAAQLNFDLKDNANALQSALDKENDSFNTAMKKAQDTLDKATQAASDARDIALKKAQDILTASLLAAQEAFDKSVKAISAEIMKQLDALLAKIAAVAAALAALGQVQLSGGGGSGPTKKPMPTEKIPSVTPITVPTLLPSGDVQLPDGSIVRGSNGADVAGGSSSYTNNISITGVNLTDPAATAQQVVSAIKFGTSVATNVSASNALSGAGQARGN